MSDVVLKKSKKLKKKQLTQKLINTGLQTKNTSEKPEEFKAADHAPVQTNVALKIKTSKKRKAAADNTEQGQTGKPEISAVGEASKGLQTSRSPKTALEKQSKPPVEPKAAPGAKKSKKRKATAASEGQPPAKKASISGAKEHKGSAKGASEKDNAQKRIPVKRWGPWKDVTIKCCLCDQKFVFTAGRHEVFAVKGVEFLPTRCKTCDEKRAFGLKRVQVIKDSNLCIVCKSAEHLHPKCPKGCFNCDEMGHASSKCPKERVCWNYKMGWCDYKRCPLPHRR